VTSWLRHTYVSDSESVSKERQWEKGGGRGLGSCAGIMDPNGNNSFLFSLILLCGFFLELIEHLISDDRIGLCKGITIQKGFECNY
jgi:hypothetical protein